jgi:hypothetical protein
MDHSWLAMAGYGWVGLKVVLVVMSHGLLLIPTLRCWGRVMAAVHPSCRPRPDDPQRDLDCELR